MNSKEALKELSDSLFCQNCLHLRKCLPHINKECIKWKEIIAEDLDRLKEIDNVWHRHEVMESVAINGNHLEELYVVMNRALNDWYKYKKFIEEILGKLVKCYLSECSNINLKKIIEEIQKEIGIYYL